MNKSVYFLIFYLTVLISFCSKDTEVDTEVDTGPPSITNTLTGSAVVNLNMVKRSLSDTKSIALTESINISNLSLLDNIIKYVINPIYASSNSTMEQISIDEDNNVSKIYSEGIDIKDFSIPRTSRSGDQFIVISGRFDNILTSNGDTMNCRVILADLETENKTKCMMKMDSNQRDEIPVAIIRDGNIDGYYENNDSLYFVVNYTEDGFAVYKSNGETVEEVYKADSGKITKIYTGDKALFGYDETISTGSPLIWGSVSKEPLNNIPVLNDRVLYYKGFVLMPGDGSGSVFFNLNNSTSTSYSRDFSINCKTPINETYSAEHSYGVFWISSDSSILCEAFELINRPEPIAYRYVDQTGQWIDINTSNGMIMGIVKIGAETRLIYDTISDGAQSLGSSRTIDLTNRMNEFNLDEVTSVENYLDGFVVIGQKNSVGEKKYYNSSTKSIITPSSADIIISRETVMPN